MRHNKVGTSRHPILSGLLVCCLTVCIVVPVTFADAWKQSRFFITFWSPPPSTNEALNRVAREGFNLTWTDESGLDVVRKQGVKAMLQDKLLDPGSLNSPDKRAKLDALIDRVKRNPALEAYFLRDEPSAAEFPGLGKLVAYLRDRDPAHVAFINLFPVYASNVQLGTTGTPEKAYRDYLQQFVSEVKPSLISYDHYHFYKNHDGRQYFLNLEMIRQTALDHGLPFLNIIQASTIEKSWRLVNPGELRWLVYTTLVYGGRGISYFLYWGPPTYGGLYQGGARTPLVDTVTVLNKELSAQSTVLMGLDNLGTYHTDPLPSGTNPVPVSSPVRFTGAGNFVVGLFGKNNNITTFMVVNRNYKTPATAQIALKSDIQVIEEFDRTSQKWKKYQAIDSKHCIFVMLNPGDGRLFRFVTLAIKK